MKSHGSQLANEQKSFHLEKTPTLPPDKQIDLLSTTRFLPVKVVLFWTVVFSPNLVDTPLEWWCQEDFLSKRMTKKPLPRQWTKYLPTLFGRCFCLAVDNVPLSKICFEGHFRRDTTTLQRSLKLTGPYNCWWKENLQRWPFEIGKHTKTRSLIMKWGFFYTRDEKVWHARK